MQRQCNAFIKKSFLFVARRLEQMLAACRGLLLLLLPLLLLSLLPVLLSLLPMLLSLLPVLLSLLPVLLNMTVTAAHFNLPPGSLIIVTRVCNNNCYTCIVTRTLRTVHTCTVALLRTYLPWNLYCIIIDNLTERIRYTKCDFISAHCYHCLPIYWCFSMNSSCSHQKHWIMTPIFKSGYVLRQATVHHTTVSNSHVCAFPLQATRTDAAGSWVTFTTTFFLLL